MVVICEECGKKYRIDAGKIKGKTAGFNCKVCQHRITISKPAPLKTTPPPDVPPPPPVTDTPEPPLDPEPTPAPAPPPPTPEKSSPSKPSKPFQAGAKNRFGLTEKIISLMLMVTLVPLFIFWGVTFQQTSGRIGKDSEKLLIQSSERLVNHLNEWLDKNFRALKVGAGLPSIRSMMSVQQVPVLETIQQGYPWTDQVFTIDRNGQEIARSDEKPLIDHADQPYFKEIMEGKETTWQVVTDKKKKGTLVLAVPIHEDESISGVLACAMAFDKITQQLSRLKQGQMGRAFLTDRAGRVIFHQMTGQYRAGQNLSGHPLVAAFKSGNKEIVSFANDKGVPFLGHSRGTDLGWILGVQAQEKEVLQILKQAQFFAYIYLLITIFVVMAIAFVAGRAMTRPIKELTQAADKISVGELDVEMNINRKDEIGDLAEAVLRMQDSLRLSIERLRKRR